MKTYLFGLFFLGLTNLMFAQNDLAFVSVTDQMPLTNNKTVQNESYINTMSDFNGSKIIMKLQNVVANYNIKATDVYSKNSTTTYTVNLKEGNNELIAVYDKDGQLLSCQENYQEIKLPYELSSKLIKENPGWALNKVYCNIEYSKESEKEISYKVVLKNGKKTKTVKINV